MSDRGRFARRIYLLSIGKSNLESFSGSLAEKAGFNISGWDYAAILLPKPSVSVVGNEIIELVQERSWKHTDNTKYSPGATHFMQYLKNGFRFEIIAIAPLENNRIGFGVRRIDLLKVG